MCRQLNLDITALVGLNSSGTAWGVAERYVYDPYGTPTVLNGASGFDADGSVTEWTADTGGASDVGFGYGHQGGRQMWSATKLEFRNRFLLTNLGTWGQIDPWHFVDGMNLYQFVTSNPISELDPLGLTVREANQAEIRGARASGRSDGQAFIEIRHVEETHTPYFTDISTKWWGIKGCTFDPKNSTKHHDSFNKGGTLEDANADMDALGKESGVTVKTSKDGKARYCIMPKGTTVMMYPESDSTGGPTIKAMGQPGGPPTTIIRYVPPTTQPSR